MTPVESVILLPSQVRFVGPALAFIRSLAASCRFSPTALNEIEVAAEEALTNVIKHAFEGSADETFRLSVAFTESEFSITIAEKGMPFSPALIAEFSPEKLQDTLESDGLGVYLMKRMMDEVRFENLGREGKSLTLVKRFRDNQTEAVAGNSANYLLVRERPHPPAQDSAFEVRPFRPEDALEISRCAYKAYGYTYEPYIYYPEQIVEMNRSGRLRSFVACEKGSGAILGHIALKFKNGSDIIAELGVAFVKPEFRKSGVFNLMNLQAIRNAAESGLYGFFVRAVTSHIASQKMAEAVGLQTCGVMLGLFPDDVDFKSLTGRIRQKESGLTLYRPFMAGQKRSIYPPDRHKEKILELFRTFAIPVHCEEGSPPDAGKTRIEAATVPALNIAELDLLSAGPDVARELQATVREFCLKRTDALFINIDLEAPCCPFVVQQCEQLGFFFAGILPFGLNSRHTLILQYMNNLAINYDIIKPYAAISQALLGYVRSCDSNREAD